MHMQMTLRDDSAVLKSREGAQLQSTGDGCGVTPDSEHSMVLQKTVIECKIPSVVLAPQTAARLPAARARVKNNLEVKQKAIC